MTQPATFYLMGQSQRPSQGQRARNKLHLLREQWKDTHGAYGTGNTAILKIIICHSGRASEVVSEARSLPRILGDERQCWAQFFVYEFVCLFVFLLPIG